MAVDNVLRTSSATNTLRGGGRSPRSAAGLFASLVLATVLLGGCDTGPAGSLYEGDPEYRPDPVLERIEPADGALAGIGSITLYGQHFSENAEENLVYFDGVPATVLSATPTQLEVRPPNTPKDELGIRITVVGAEHFSNVLGYRLAPAAEPFGDVKAFEEPFAIATNDESEVFVALFAGGVSVGIQQITAEGDRIPYAETRDLWSAIDFGPDGTLYGVRNVRAVFRFAPGGGAPEAWSVASDRSARFQALDVDPDGNVWAGGAGGQVYRVTQEGATTASAVEGTVRALRVREGMLYAAVSADGGSRVLRFPIGGDGALGAAEVVLDVAGAYDGAEARALAFAADGTLYVGTDAADPVLEVHADGSWDVLYPDVLQPTAAGFAWGAGTSLYMLRAAADGSTPGVTRIDTRREGAR